MKNMNDFSGGFPQNIQQPDVLSIYGIEIKGKAEDIFYFIERIGGKNGWYSYDPLLTVRGWFSGGYGKYRIENKELKAGGKVDFFDIHSFVRNRELNLMFSMKGIDGEANFYIKELDCERAILASVGRFKFTSLFGKVYWWLIKPFDYLMRRKMLLNIKKYVENDF